MDKTESQYPYQGINVGGNQVDDLFTLLKHRYRRYIIERLWIADNPIMSEKLALEIAAREEGVSVDNVELEKADQIRIALHHTHLPKLEDVSVLEYDDATGIVFLTERAMDIIPQLTTVSGTEISTTNN